MPVLSDWLELFNNRMGREGVPHIGRPMRAWSEWCRETGESFGMDDPKAQQIFQWFETRSPPGSLYFPSVFTGAFYFDAYFWPVHVQIVCGTQMLEGRDALLSMPPATIDRLFRSTDDLENFKAVWADCLDYGNGLRDLCLDQNMLRISGGPTDFWRSLVVSGDRKLRSAVEDLCGQRPGENAMQSSREACEMFLKSFLARNDGLTEEDAKKTFNHGLSRLLDRILQITPNTILSEAKTRLNRLPEVSDRYAGKAYHAAELWDAYKVAQAVAAEVTRIFAKRNIRGQLATRS